MNPRKIVIAGGSGFLGRTLADWFARRHWRVVVLGRGQPPARPNVRFVQWDACTLGPWCQELNDALAVVNLAGRSVNCRYTAENRRRIMDSRVLSTRILGQAIAHCQRPPQVWLNSSTATIYKHSLHQEMDELTGIIAPTREARDAFSIAVATAWEKALNDTPTPQTRKVALRAAMVFGNEPGGVFQILARLTRLGLGGAIAGGNQFVSWIHQMDFCRAVEWLIDRPDVAGPVNIASPSPVTNRHMMHILRDAIGIPIGLPATRWMLEIGTFLLRTEAELVIKSRRVVPARLLAEGFVFQFPQMPAAIADLLEQSRRQISLKNQTLPDRAGAP
jgi:uncharacterized protein (TIGR01777 family)